MAEKSLFAMLLRSPWWISFGVVGVIVLVAGALLPQEFFVVGCIAAWRQWRAPSPAKVAQLLQDLASMPWRTFADTLAAAWTDAGCAVERLPAQGAADLRLTRGATTTLVSARRWKAATHGVEPLRELQAAMAAADASAGVYVAALGQVSDNARVYARDHGIVVLQGDAVAQLLLKG